MKVDSQIYFNTGDEQYPKDRQGNLTLLEKLTKSSVRQHTTSEVTQSTKRYGAINKQLTPYYKQDCKSMQ